MTRAALWVSLVLTACAGKQAEKPATCPPCECVCNQGAAGPSTPAPTPVSGDVVVSEVVSDLITSATRKMNFKDGVGCLADLDQLAGVSPKFAARMVYLRGQCEMLSGQCQQGKDRLIKTMREDSNIHVDRATASAEAMAAMYCRGGDSSDRDRLLGAIQELVTGAYSETRTVAQCKASVDTIQALLPKVKPRDVDDTQVESAGRSLFATAPGCYARAGDCSAAWQAFRALYPQDALKQMKDDKVRQEALSSSFDSIVPRCKGKR